MATCFVDGAPLTSMRDPWLGATIAGRYELDELIGIGGMASVYKARQKNLDRLVALKCLRADNAAAVARLQTEAQAVARLSHPNIVQIFEVGESAGQPFLTLEYLDGGTLAERLKALDPDAMSPREALDALYALKKLL